MNAEKPLLLQVQILLLRQKMAQQRHLIQQQLLPQQQEECEQFPRSLGMRLLLQQLSNASPWLMTLKNKIHGKESALLWSVALTLGQHWLKKNSCLRCFALPKK